MPATLTKPPLDAEQTEKRLRELLNQFGKFYFTGAPVATAGGARTFPECEMVFNANQAGMQKPTIHIAFFDMRPERRWEKEGEVQYTVEALLSIWVRVANRGDSFNKNDHLCAAIADALRWLLISPRDRAALAQKGILHVKVERGPIAQPAVGFQVRFLSVSARLRFAVPV